MSTTTPDAPIAAIVLAGGRASRLGQPKPSAVVDGEPLLRRALDAVQGLRCAVVGPPELAALLRPHDDAALVREEPAFGGPVAGIAAGYDHLVGTEPVPEWMVVLACDLPRAAAAVRVLVASLETLRDADAGACLVAGDRPQWLCGIYRSAAIGSGIRRLHRVDGIVSAPVRALLGPFELRLIEGSDDLAFDVDTPADLLAANSSDERTTR